MRLYSPNDANPRALAEAGEEVWSSLGDHPFFVSNLGNVVRVRREGLIEPVVPHPSTQRGYLMVYLRGLGKAYVHRLVSQVFDGRDARRVCHISTNLTDNRLCNLERRVTNWTTPELREAIRARLQEGIRPSVVAREFGLTQTHVSFLARSARKLRDAKLSDDDERPNDGSS